MGLRRGTAPLLKLGLKLRSRELVAHPLSQGVLDDQWRGRDPACSSVMLKTETVKQHTLFVRLLLLTLIGWSGLRLPTLTVPIVLNDANAGHVSARERRSRKCDRRLCARLGRRLQSAAALYSIPCIKHMLALMTVSVRFAFTIPYGLRSVRDPIEGGDITVFAFFASAALHEAKVAAKQGFHVYTDRTMNFSNWVDGFHLFIGAISCAMRVAGSFETADDDSTSGDASSGGALLKLGGSQRAVDSSDDPFQYIFRVAVAVSVIAQLSGLSRLIGAFETIGVLFQARTAASRTLRQHFSSEMAQNPHVRSHEDERL